MHKNQSGVYFLHTSNMLSHCLWGCLFVYFPLKIWQYIWKINSKTFWIKICIYLISHFYWQIYRMVFDQNSRTLLTIWSQPAVQHLQANDLTFGLDWLWTCVSYVLDELRAGWVWAGRRLALLFAFLGSCSGWTPLPNEHVEMEICLSTSTSLSVCVCFVFQP